MQEKAKHHIIKARLADFLLPLIFTSIVFFSFFSLSSDIKSRERSLCEGSAVHAASRISASIGDIVRNGGRMASAIQANPNLPLREMSLLASNILNLGNAVTGVSVAPNAVVKYHFPESGDQSPIGHDLLSNPERRDALARAMESGQPILSGPEESMEGGQSVFIRFPIFQSSKIWGFVSVTVDFGGLIAGFTAPGAYPGIVFAIAVRDEGAAQAAWSLAAGAKAAYDARGVFAPVSLPGTEWHIFAMPERGWTSSSPYLYVLFIAGLMASVLLFLAIGSRRTPKAGTAGQYSRQEEPRSPQPHREPAARDAQSHVPPAQHVAEDRKLKKEVRFKGQKVKGELYMPEVLLSGDPESLFRSPDTVPSPESIASAAPRTAAPEASSSAPPEPAASSVPSASRQNPASSKSRAVSAKQEPLFTMEDDPVRTPPSILVVDDSEANRDIMGRMLSLRGYAADFAASGEEALIKAETGNYKVVFMDCFMPVMDGYQTSAALRSRFPASAMKIIGISARIGDQEAARCSLAGMDALLAKPFTLKELQATLEKHG